MYMTMHGRLASQSRQLAGHASWLWEPESLQLVLAMLVYRNQDIVLHLVC